MSGIDTATKSLLHFQNRVWTFAGTAQVSIYGLDVCNGGTATASREYTTYTIDKAFDNNTGTFWDCYPASYPEWAKYDLGAGVTKTAAQYTITSPVSAGYPKTWTFEGSNNDTDWTVIDTQTDQSFTAGVKRTFNSFSNSTAYRYYRWNVSAGNNNDMTVTEFEIMEEVGGKFGDGSLLLGGTGDYLSTSASADFAFGTGDFTIDFWIRPHDVSAGDRYVFDTRNSSLLNGVCVFIRENKIGFNCASGDYSRLGTTSLSADTWYHVALVNKVNGSKVMNLYLDGVAEVEAYTHAYDFTNSNCFIGQRSDASLYYNGHIDELRITKGLARWTANFTPSTAAYSDDANTVSLLHFDEADGSTFTKDVAANWAMDGAAQFYDESGKVWTAYGDAQLDTAQKKWVASGLFDGTGDYLRTPYTSDFDPSGKDWTIDCWFRASSFAATQALYAKATYGSSYDISITIVNSTTIGSWTNETHSNYQVTVPTMSVDTWYHVALVRNGGVVNIYLDGVNHGAGSNMAYTNASQSYVTVGADNWNNPGAFFSGHIDELRISKGIARWTSNFTPPTAEYSVDDIVIESASANAVFEGTLSFEAVVTAEGEASSSFAAGYYYEKSNLESAEAAFTNAVETRVTQLMSAEATADIDAVYWVVIQQRNIDLQLPYLSARTGYNAWAEPEAWLPTLEAYTGGQLDATLQLPTLSSDVFVSPIVDGSARVPFPYATASITMEGLCFLTKNMYLPSISAEAYMTGDNDLDKTLQFFELYATAVNSRSFSTYVLEYTR